MSPRARRPSRVLAQRLREAGYDASDAITIAQTIPGIDDVPSDGGVVGRTGVTLVGTTAALTDAVLALATAGLTAHRVGLLLRSGEALPAHKLLKHGMLADDLDTISQGEWLNDVCAALDSGASLKDTIRVCRSAAVTSLDLVAFTDAAIPSDALDALIELDPVNRHEILRVVRADDWDTITALLAGDTLNPAGAINAYSNLLQVGVSELAGIPVDVRVLASRLAADTGDAALDLLPVAAAAGGQPWAGTFETLLRDTTTEQHGLDSRVAAGDPLTSALLAARALENDLPTVNLEVEHAALADVTLAAVNARTTQVQRHHADAYAAVTLGQPWAEHVQLTTGSDADTQIAYAAAILAARETLSVARPVTIDTSRTERNGIKNRRPDHSRAPAQGRA
jgi:hypothetical protein